MWKHNSYPNIDLEKTGIHLKSLIQQRGYTVKDIQKILHLSCPQPVYRWYKGQILPSVDHLYVLSKLLCVHMEELLLPAQENFVLIELWRNPAFPKNQTVSGAYRGRVLSVSRYYEAVLSAKTCKPSQEEICPLP